MYTIVHVNAKFDNDDGQANVMDAMTSNINIKLMHLMQSEYHDAPRSFTRLC